LAEVFSFTANVQYGVPHGELGDEPEECNESPTGSCATPSSGEFAFVFTPPQQLGIYILFVHIQVT
jgi:hypothetical protein